MRPVPGGELGHGVVDVGLDGERADAQAYGDGVVGQLAVTSTSTSRSLTVRASRPATASAPPPEVCWETKRAIRLFVADGESSASPAATVLMAPRSSSGSAPLPRKPAAPARIACTTYSSASKVVRTRTAVSASAGSAVISRVAAMPSVPGMRMSIRTTSGRSARATATVCAPSAASPTTSMSASDSTSTRSAPRINAWSSASSTRTDLAGRSSCGVSVTVPAYGAPTA